MRETLIKLDDINTELQEQLTLQEGRAIVDEKWLDVFDALIEEIIQTRVVMDFVTTKKRGVDWGFVQESIKKTKSLV